MSEIKPDLQAWQTLRTVLADAFKTRADIANLTEFSLGKTIDQIPTDGNDTMSLIGGVLRWCVSQGGNTLQLLLEGALAHRPYHHDLHKIAGQFGVKSSGVKSARRPMRALTATEREESRFAAQQLRNKYPQIDSFDEQVWQEILAFLNLEFSVVTSSGRTDKRRFENLVGTMKQQNRLGELESVIHRAAQRRLNEEKERNDLIAKFKRAYDQSDWDRVIDLSRRLERLNAHDRSTSDNTARAYKNRGARHLDNRNHASAIECFTQAIHYGSRAIQASCYYSRGQAYFAQGLILRHLMTLSRLSNGIQLKLHITSGKPAAIKHNKPITRRLKFTTD